MRINNSRAYIVTFYAVVRRFPRKTIAELRSFEIINKVFFKISVRMLYQTKLNISSSKPGFVENHRFLFKFFERYELR